MAKLKKNMMHICRMSLEEHGVLLNSRKCEIKVTEVRFLRHLLSDKGISPATSKVEAVEQFRAPNDKDGARVFWALYLMLPS